MVHFSSLIFSPWVHIPHPQVLTLFSVLPAHEFTSPALQICCRHQKLNPYETHTLYFSAPQNSSQTPRCGRLLVSLPWPLGLKLPVTASLAAACGQVTMSNFFLTYSEGHHRPWTLFLSPLPCVGVVPIFDHTDEHNTLGDEKAPR